MSSPSTTARTQEGFTLVELMVSLMIFGILSAAGVALLSFSVRAQEAAEARLDELSQLRRLNSLLAGDLGQAAPRVHRDESGGVRPAFTGASGEAQGTALAFVRRGWENVEGRQRPSLQKVEYRFEEGRLVRIGYPLVDGAAPMPGITMLTGVAALRLRFRDSEGSWRDRWDPSEPAQIPVAVELVAQIEGSGRVRQLFLTGSGGA